jgi:TRAP-type C4-dicarboxylate transport system permease large subunit
VPQAEAAAQADLLPALRGALPVVVLFAVVIGGRYGGVFTATESAGVGAVGAFLLALGCGRLTRVSLLRVFSETRASIAMIHALTFGGLCFAFYVNLGGAPDMVTGWIATIDARPVVILVVIIVICLLLGSVMDSFAVMIITVPVVTPLVLDLGYGILFWGLKLVVVETGMITPPFGTNLFVLKALQPDVKLGAVMRGVVPFVLADLVKIVPLVAFPALSLWSPSTTFPPATSFSPPRVSRHRGIPRRRAVCSSPLTARAWKSAAPPTRSLQEGALGNGGIMRPVLARLLADRVRATSARPCGARCCRDRRLCPPSRCGWGRG